MTEIKLIALECGCKPKDAKHLVITEGNTTIWACPHVMSYERKVTEAWMPTR